MGGLSLERSSAEWREGNGRVLSGEVRVPVPLKVQTLQIIPPSIPHLPARSHCSSENDREYRDAISHVRKKSMIIAIKPHKGALGKPMSSSPISMSRPNTALNQEQGAVPRRQELLLCIEYPATRQTDLALPNGPTAGPFA